MALLGLGVEQLRIEGRAEIGGVQRLVLGQVCACEEAVEVGVAGVRDVELVGLESVALRPEAGCVVMRQALVGLQEALVKRSLLRERLRLRRGQELGVVETRRRCWVA